MINEEKVRELFNIALCDSKSDDSRVQKQSASYYGVGLYMERET